MGDGRSLCLRVLCFVVIVLLYLVMLCLRFLILILVSVVSFDNDLVVKKLEW